MGLPARHSGKHAGERETTLKIDQFDLEGAVSSSLQLQISIDIRIIGGGHAVGKEEQAEAFDCLRHLLEFQADTETPIRCIIEKALDDNEDARLLLRLSGIRIVTDFAAEEGFVVAASGHSIHRIYADSPWHDGAHRFALANLPGARPTGPMNFNDGRAARGVFVPARLLHQVRARCPQSTA
ncbi:hypothetical protein M1D80_11950 [Phyllobacteriaceae bacterium JZ32]